MNDKAGLKELIRRTYETLKAGEADAAQNLLRQALEIDYEHPEVLYALKCLNWWLGKLERMDDFHSPCERGEYILSLWKPYYAFLERMGDFPHGASILSEPADSCQYAIKRFAYCRALDCFKEHVGTGSQDPALLLQMGRCCKGAGEWDDAARYLEMASSLKRDDSAILSELADVKALLGEERTAKVLFREAFFLEPQEINLHGLESEMMLQLLGAVKKMGYAGAELAEWIPVWGCILGAFSLKRELKPVELGRLKQSILALESEHRNPPPRPELALPPRGKGGGAPFTKPRLLNRYFWLIDHCEHNRDTSGLIDETMLKIKVIDSVVYEQYRS
ncbi:MAG: hypothetical protein FWC65_05375 [Treponema sp.]|nr:hypothetical protein [Treponema sp.]